MFTKERRLKAVAGVGLSALMLGALAGCANGSEDSGDGTTTISYVQYYGQRADERTGLPLYELVDRFMEANPDIIVEMRFVTSPDFNRDLLQSASAGKQATIAQIDSNDTAMFAQAGIAADVTDRATEWGEAGSYYDAVWATTQVDGATFALPGIGDTYGLYFNQDLLDAAGVSVPETWDELEAAARELSRDGAYGLALAGGTGTVDGIYPTLMRFLAESTDVTQVAGEAGTAMLETMTELVDSGAVSDGMITWIEDDAFAQFTTGKAAMMINSAGYVKSLTNDFTDLNWAVAPMPSGSEQGLTYLQSENLIMSPTATESEADAAWKLMTFMQLPEELEIYLPARSKLSLRTDVELENPVTKEFSSYLSNAWAPTGPERLNWAEISSLYQVAMESAVSGSSSISDALAAMQSSIDKVLADAE